MTGLFTTTSAGITQFKQPKKDDKYLADFMSQFSDAKAGKAILNGKKIGGLIFARGALELASQGVFNYSMIPSSTTFGDKSTKYVLGNASNDPVQEKPTLVPQEVLKSAYIARKISDINEDVALPKGASFSIKDVEGDLPELAITLKNLDGPSKVRVDYKIVLFRVRLCLLIA